MMKSLSFTKMVATGNDFIVIDNRSAKLNNLKILAKKLCNRKLGIGADGLLVLEKSKRADVKMRIFNSDGSEPGMCGNGARCFAVFARNNGFRKNKLKIQTKPGILYAEIPRRDTVKLKMTQPHGIKLNFPIKINNRKLKVNFINTGVPHVVVFVSGVDKINANNIGRSIRYHKKFMPKGANANFIEVVNKNTIKMRTYERGVEDETSACGTGAVASAIIFDIKSSQKLGKKTVHVQTEGGALKIYFNRMNRAINDVWLEGEARLVYKGVYDV